MHKPKTRHYVAVLSTSILSLMPLTAFAQMPMQVPSPPPSSRGGDRGPAVFVQTDVVGGHGFNITEELPTVKLTKFHTKADAKNYLLETTSDTTCKNNGAELTLDSGRILVYPNDGHVIVHTPTTDVSIPHGTVALIEHTNDCSRALNLSGQDVIVRVLRSDDPKASAHIKDSLAIEAGLGYMDTDRDKSNLTKGAELLDPSLTPERAKQLAKVKGLQLISFDPMKVLQHHTITKQLKTNWLAAMTKVEKTSNELIVIREKLPKLPPPPPGNQNEEPANNKKDTAEEADDEPPSKDAKSADNPANKLIPPPPPRPRSEEDPGAVDWDLAPMKKNSAEEDPRSCDNPNRMSAPKPPKPSKSGE